MSSLVLAQEAGGGFATYLVLLVLMAGVFYFLIIRPQRKQVRDRQHLADSLTIGQEIRTIGGIQGRVTSVDDHTVVLEVEQGRIRIARRAVGSRIGDEEDTA